MKQSKDMLSDALLGTTNDNISVPMGLIAPVDAVMRRLGFDVMFKEIKSKGIDLFALVTGLMVHSMDEDNSLAATAQWMSNPVVKSHYGIPEGKNVSQRTLNRTLEALGANDEAIVVRLNKGIGRLFPGLDHDAIADGSSIAANSDYGELAAPGHPRDRNPDGMQVEFMLGMMERSRIPFYIRTFPGNTSDEEMFSTSLPEMMSLLDYGDMHSHDDVKDRLLEDMERRRDERRQGGKGRGRPKEGDGSPSFDQLTGPGSLLSIRRALGNASWVVMDNGGASQYNTKAIMEMGHEYLTRKTMGANDVAFFENGEAVEIEPGLTCVSHTFESSGRTKYVFFSKDVYEMRLRNARVRIQRMLNEARAIRDGEKPASSLVTVRENSFIQIENRITIQDILVDHTPEEMEEIARKSLGPTTGFFKLESSRQLTPVEALSKYRRRVAVEHAISSLKNEVRMKPLRVWKGYSVRGRMILGLLIEAVMAIIRNLVPKGTRKVTRNGVTRVEDASPSLKKLVFSLCQLTATSFVTDDGGRTTVYSNMDDRIRGILTSIRALGSAVPGV